MGLEELYTFFQNTTLTNSTTGYDFVSSHPLFQMLFGNSVFSAGLALMIIKALYDHGKAHFVTLMQAVKRRFFYTLVIDSKSEAFEWVLKWLAEQNYGAKKARNMTVRTKSKKHSFDDEDDEDVSSAKKKRPVVHFVPSYGSHFLMYENRPTWITKARQSKELGELTLQLDQEKLTISMLGFNCQDALRRFLQECMDVTYSEIETKTNIYIAEQGSYSSSWIRVCGRENRSLDSVILDDEVKEALLKDLTWFMKEKQYYKECGLSYRRGYLLYGPPGTGKTSLLLALAGHFKMTVCIISLSTPEMSDRKLTEMMNSTPPNSLLLLEDIDAAFVKREASDSASQLSFSGLLNALDGVATLDRRIVFMTTNHIDKLSAALIRPGRVDFKVKFDLATTSQIRQMYIRFVAIDVLTKNARANPDSISNDEIDSEVMQQIEERADEISRMIPTLTCSPAQLQCFFMKHRTTPFHELKARIPDFIAECIEEKERHEREANEMQSKADEAEQSDDAEKPKKRQKKRQKKRKSESADKNTDEPSEASVSASLGDTQAVPPATASNEDQSASSAVDSNVGSPNGATTIDEATVLSGTGDAGTLRKRKKNAAN